MIESELSAFFMSKGAAGGAIGGILLIGISFFTDIAQDIKAKSWKLKILYVILGALFCASIDHSADSLEIRNQLVLIVYVIIGAFWPSFFIQMKSLYETYKIGKQNLD